ncbi:nucleotidyltransferase domain-containing protein [Microbacterium sp.]|uniref:nucleotidyltransferase domain-containing protein n=1 Tax=Microbacterium sp. TaxID=51671 RepID=UPI0039E6AE7F
MELQHPFRAITTSVDGDVLQVLASTHDEMTVSRLALLIPERSGPGIRLAADRLVDQGILRVRRIGRVRAYGFNDDHLLAPALRQIAQAKSLLVTRLQSVFNEAGTPLAVLFGSAASGEMNASSDVDILVVRPADADLWDEKLADLTVQISRLTGNDARIIDIDVEDLTAEQYAPLIDDVVREGIALAGDLSELRARRDRRRS